jgi:Leucine-rich repeat (LRR) protein
MSRGDAPTLSSELIKRTTGEYDVEMVQWLDLPEQGFRRIEALSPCINLLKLSLAGNKIRTIEGLDTLVRLQRLDLSSNSIQRIGTVVNTIIKCTTKTGKRNRQP